MGFPLLLGLFTKLCTVEADTLTNSESLIPRHSINIFGRRRPEQWFKMAFDVVLSFGLTELKAQIAWKEGVSAIGLQKAKLT